MEPIDISGSSSATSGNKTGPVTFGSVAFGTQNSASVGGSSGLLLVALAIGAFLFFRH